MADLYLCVRDDVEALFAANWSEPGVPVLWRDNDIDPMPDPGVSSSFLRNTVLPGIEKTIAYGGGPGANEKLLFGTVEFIVFTARSPAAVQKRSVSFPTMWMGESSLAAIVSTGPDGFRKRMTAPVLSPLFTQ